MSRRTTDLTRWNREGLERFRYVDGNAATFLAQIRHALAERFRDPNPTWDGIAPSDDLLADYFADPDSTDWGYDIARALARAAHILAEHMDAYANEGFLRTATQWESVRRLVGMIGYRPAPQASASALVVLTAKASGKIDSGLEIAGSRPDAAPITFQTLADVDVDPRWNEMRPEGWDRSPLMLSGREVELIDPDGLLAVGDPIIFEQGRNRFATSIDSVEPRGEVTVVGLGSPLPENSGLRDADTLVYVQPRVRLRLGLPVAAPHRSSGVIVTSTTGHPFRHWEAVCLLTTGGYQYDLIADVDGSRITLTSSIESPSRVARPGQVEAPDWLLEVLGYSNRSDVSRRSPRASGSIIGTRAEWERRMGEHIGLLYTASGITLTALIRVLRCYAEDDGATGVSLDISQVGYVPTNSNSPPMLLLPPAQADMGLLLDQPLGAYSSPVEFRVSQHAELPPGPAALVSRNRVALLAPGTKYPCDGGWHLSAHIGPAPDDDEFWLSDAIAYADFAGQLMTASSKVNPRPFHGHRFSLSPGAEPPPQGRHVVFECGDDGHCHAARITSSTSDAIEFSPPLTVEDGFVVGETTLHANVVLAGHGERRPERALGSGDATRSNQTLHLDVAGVSFVADPSFPTGTRADVEVIIDGERWRQSPRLDDCGPTDPIYTVQVTESGTLDFAFGDGRHGRRLPTGRGNVRVRYRVGAGLKGNLPPGSLTRLASAHPLIESVSQPLPASGGNDREEIASMRENAPRSVLTMGRAVSLADFEALTMQHASVWQARARRATRAGCRFETIEVAVVPAGGAELTDMLRDTVRSRLRSASAPGIRFSIVRCELRAAEVAVAVGCDMQRFDPKVVEATLRKALATRFSLARRRIEQPLHAADIHEVAHQTAGVIHVDVRFGERRTSTLAAAEKTVWFIDEPSLDVVVGGARR